MPKILFVCTGNTCRSPMAQALWQRSHPGDAVQSAGLAASPGQPAAAHSRTLFPELGEHSSQQLSAALVQWADHIYCMTGSHRRHLLEGHPRAADKTLLVRPDGDIQDPYGGSLEDYRACVRDLEATQLCEQD